MPADFVMMGGQFEKVSGEDMKLADIDFGSTFSGPVYDDQGIFKLTAPQVQVAYANKGGTSTFFFLSDGKWVGPGDDDYGPGWVDTDGGEVEPTVSLGIGFWYKDAFNSARAVNNAGQVLSDISWEKTFAADYRMLVCPYPKNVALAEINFVNIADTAPAYDEQGAFKSTATQIQVPYATKGGFSDYYFLSDGKWVGPGDDDYAPGWVDRDGAEIDPNEIKIPAGRGCWFRPNAEMTVIFSM